jgi:hypothetical protein
VVCLALLLVVGGCGCAASPERHDDAVTTTAHEQDAWGATFTLPDGWTGGANDSGGFEFTDGEVALMVGRHPLASGQSLSDFMNDRAKVLSDLGAAPNGKARSEKIGNADVITIRASADAGLEVELMVARLGPTEGLSLMMVAEAGARAKLDVAWASVAKTLALP